MIGHISSFNRQKAYGFIQTDDSQSYFFHITKFHGEIQEIKIGLEVEFSLTEENGRAQAINVKLTGKKVSGHVARKRNHSRKPIGSYTGPTLDLTDEQRKSALTDISRWKLEARLDDIKRYFFTVPELQNIITGDASYVIGRKGTGKTALVQYLSDRAENPSLVTKLTFKNFPFNELYSQANNAYTRPNQYITIWKLIIYSSACQLMLRSKSMDPLIRQNIEKAFPEPESDNLGTVVGKWIAGDFGFKVLGTGLDFKSWFKEKKVYSIQQKVENLESFVKKYLPTEQILILFDELDEDYKEMFENYGRSEYLDLLTSLFKAVQDVRAVFKDRGPSLLPVIFLRDDIYDLIQDADKNKWRDFEVDLEWNNDGILALLAHRLAKVMDSECQDFDTLWYSIFTKKPLVYSHGNKEIAAFDYIRMSTQGRPRDYINYLQECAKIELKRSANIISEDTIKDTDKIYSNYLKKELIDEVHGIIPDISNVLSIFSETRKWILSIEEFRDAYLERSKGGKMSVDDVDFVLRTLFYFSIIGNVARVGVHIFRHERPSSQLNFKEKIVVHRGLMKALQII